MYKAIVFDFDGTIADTVSAIDEGGNLTMRLHGLPEHSYTDIVRFINHGPRELIRRALPERLQSDSALVDRVLEDYNRFYGEVYLHTRRAYSGIPELISCLHGSHRIGVLSNKQDLYVRKLCEQVLLPGSYDETQGVFPGAPTKPNPFLPNRIAEKLGVSPAECAMIGDSDVDIDTARNAGMTHIGVSWGYRDEAFLRAHGAVSIAHTPQELAQLLEGV